MWRFIVLVGVLLGIGTNPVQAQQWTGTAALGLSGGHQTNLYLDPVLGTWNSDVSSPFLALTPRIGVIRSARRTQVNLMVRARMHPQRTDVPQFTQSTLNVRYRLNPEWTIGFGSGGTRYRFPALQGGSRTSRDSWWLLPSLQWSPTRNTMFTLRSGFTQRFERLPTFTDRQTSGLASLRATQWLSDRVRGGVRLYYSSGRTSTAETTFGGTGGTLSATYWPSGSVSIRTEAALEQLEYETLDPSGTVQDRIARTGLTTEWTPRPSVTVFTRAQALRANLGEDGSRTDVHLSAGLRLQLQQDLGGTTEPPPQRRVCQNTDDGLRIRIPYDGNGTPHVTGDFTSWSTPGTPLESTDEEMWEATLDVPPGRYAYRIRIVDDEQSEWLDLPSYAQTTEDPFGGTNGVCTVH